MTIPEQVSASKAVLSRIPADVLILLVLVLSSTAAFGLGVLTGKDMGAGSQKGDLWIEQLPQQVKGGGGPAAASAAPKTIQASPKPETVPVAAVEAKVYVASKSGTKYYLPTCGSVKRIKEENKVWFATKAAAAAAGYEPSTSCKGL